VTDLVRFPRTPHLAWLGKGTPREDKVLSTAERSAFLSGELVVEEKVDGANVGIAASDEGGLLAWNRGTLLHRGQCHPQFGPLFRWMAEREAALLRVLRLDLALFGEWCYAVHSVRYTRLPDWLLVFDVYDFGRERFWSTSRRNALAAELGCSTVPELARGRCDLPALRALFSTSRLGEAPAEGLYLRRETDEWLVERAKLLRPEFIEGIEEHWRKRPMETNRLATGPARVPREACP